MKDWLEYIDSKFANYEIRNLEKNFNSFYPSRFYKMDGIAISFEFDGTNILRKAECYSYKNDRNLDISSIVTAILDTTKPNNISFTQNSFDGAVGKDCRLVFNEENKIALDQFLLLPLKFGWTEKEYSYKDEVYKVTVESKDLNFVINPLTDSEINMPILGDRFGRKFESYIIDMFCNKKYIKHKTSTILPLCTPVNSF